MIVPCLYRELLILQSLLEKINSKTMKSVLLEINRYQNVCNCIFICKSEKNCR